MAMLFKCFETALKTLNFFYNLFALMDEHVCQEHTLVLGKQVHP